MLLIMVNILLLSNLQVNGKKYLVKTKSGSNLVSSMKYGRNGPVVGRAVMDDEPNNGGQCNTQCQNKCEMKCSEMDIGIGTDIDNIDDFNGGVTPASETTPSVTTPNNQYTEITTDIIWGREKVDTFTSTKWITKIRELVKEQRITTQPELTMIEKFAKTNPDELISILNEVLMKNFDKKEVRYIVTDIIKEASEYVTGNIKIQNPSTSLITSKITTWKKKITEITQKDSTLPKDIIQQFEAILNSHGAATNTFTIIKQIERMMTISTKSKPDLEKILTDVKRSTLISKMAYLLINYDNSITEDVKTKFAVITSSEEDKYPYDKIVEYVKTLLTGNTVPLQIQSELRTICKKLGVEVTQSKPGGNGGILTMSKMEKFITRMDLISKLSSSSTATFNVDRMTDCSLVFCDASILEAACAYGYGECGFQASSKTDGSGKTKSTCTVTVKQCNKESSVKTLTTEEVLKELKTKGSSETVTFSLAACKDICTAWTKNFRFGGISCSAKYFPTTRKCTVRSTMEMGLNTFVDKNCDCDHSKLGFLDPEKVGKQAPNTNGIKFRTHDEDSCKQFCDPDSDIPTTCGGTFSCGFHVTCWPGSFCACTVKHTCKKAVKGFGFRSGKINSVTKDGNDTQEATVKKPMMLPDVSEGTVVINRVTEPKTRRRRRH